MIVLSKGYKLPETGDFGDVWFPALEDNIQQMNDHTHNGTDGERLFGKDFLVSTATVLVGSFADQGNGYFRATVTVPTGRTVDDFVITFRDPTSKEQMHLKHEKLSSTQFYVYINVAQTIEVCYGV